LPVDRSEGTEELCWWAFSAIGSGDTGGINRSSYPDAAALRFSVLVAPPRTV
jgi:hypothetical protein